MDKETKKIALACFIGGVLCCAVALMFSPNFWWLGLIAGAAGGYISYEFREVWKAIPIALRSARSSGAECRQELGKVCLFVKNWFSKPHPFGYFGAILTVPYIIWTWQSSAWEQAMKYHDVCTRLVCVLMKASFMYGGSALVLCIVLIILAEIGVEIEKKYFFEGLIEIGDGDRDAYVTDMQKIGFQEAPATYANVARWIGKGIFVVIKFFMWKFWKLLGLGLWAVIRSVGLFLWFLFKLIHSEERVLCALDGTLGGALSYYWFAPTATTLASQVLLCLFGGLLGAAFGIVNWEIVSKRWLKVHIKVPSKYPVPE